MLASEERIESGPRRVDDGFINSAMLYMEHFPYITRLWFGEYLDYDQGPDYWMTEVAGIPFGLMGEMLQDRGHAYRGLLYGMTARKYGNVDPLIPRVGRF